MITDAANRGFFPRHLVCAASYTNTKLPRNLGVTTEVTREDSDISKIFSKLVLVQDTQVAQSGLFVMLVLLTAEQTRGTR